MKKILLLALALFVCSTAVNAKLFTKKEAKPKVKKELRKEVKKDVLKDKEYKELKEKYFNAEGYGDTYNCWVEQQRFCKVKDLDTGVYVLCDRDVSRKQWESAKIFYKYGRCTKLN